MAEILQTDRLRLDELQVGRDELFIFELLNEPGFLAHIGDRGITDLAAARGYIETGPIASYARRGFGLWRVRRKLTDEPVGICGLIKRDDLPEEDVGYAILDRWAGQGFAGEAAAAVIRHGREVLGLTRISAITSHDNAASMRVLARLGFRDAGVVRVGGHETDSRYFLSEA